MKRGAKIAERLLDALTALLVVASLCFWLSGNYAAAYALLAVGLVVVVIASLIDL
jgi:hypothetical protein